MGLPRDVRVIDTMLGIPRPVQERTYDFMRGHFMDEASRTEFRFPAEYMFKQVPHVRAEDFVADTVAKMDRHGIATALLGYVDGDDDVERALSEHPTRFVPELHVDPNHAMEEVRRIRRIHAKVGLRALGGFGAGAFPAAPVGDKRWYPIYALACELGLPVFTCLGIPGPRVRAEPQHVRELDDVLAYFPDLVLVLRHGVQPWVEEVILRMREHPNLHYSTTAFAPKHYPPEILRFAGEEGRSQVLYGGYYPAGLTLERIFAELPALPLDDATFRAFLHDNAARILRIP